MPPAKKSSPASPPSPGAYVPGTDPLNVAPAAVAHIAAELAAFAPQPPLYEPKVAAELLVAYRPRLAAIPADRLDFPRVDVDSVCRHLLAVYALTQHPAVRPFYEAAAAQGHFDLANLEHLKSVTLVLLHASRLADAAGAFRNAKVSADLDAKSAEVEGRLQKVCEHFFGNHPVLGPVLRRYSPGTGYLDRAYDLLGYADIYEEQHAIVSTDPLHYRTTDREDARKLAAQILQEIGATMGPEAREAFDLLRRTWTLLKPLYFEVQQIGLAALRYDPQREERFPSLYVVGRKGQGRRKGSAEASAAGAPAQPGEPDGI